MKSLFAAFTLTLSLIPALGAEIPEVFVQTGHTQEVSRFALSENQMYLVSAEYHVMKLWEVGSAREIRTIKVNGSINNVYFQDDSTFVVILGDTAATYNIYGDKTGQINLHTPANEGGVKRIARNGKYVYADRGKDGGGVFFYDLSDGSELKLPEKKGGLDYSDLLDLGFGFYGIFFRQDTMAGNRSIHGTGYVIYDEDLKAVKRGFLTGVFWIGANIKVDPNLRYLYKNQDFGENPTFMKLSLETGDTLFSMTGKKQSHLTVLPDGKIILSKKRFEAPAVMTEHGLCSEDLWFVEMMDDGLSKEKSMVLENLGYDNPYVVGRNGLLIAGLKDGSVKKYDYTTGREGASFGATPVVLIFFSYANGKLLNLDPDFSSTQKLAKLTFNLWNLKTASLEKFNVSNSTNAMFQKKSKFGGIMLWTLSDPDALWSKVPKEFFKENFKKEYMDFYDKPNSTPEGLFLKDPVNGELQFSNRDEHYSSVNHINVFNKTSKSEVARLFAFADGEWIIITSEGYFNASPNGAKYLNVRVGQRVYSIDNFYEQYFNPGIVASVLEGGKVEMAADMRKGVLPPPEVTITSPTDGKRCDTDTLTVTVSARDMGGGIDEIRLYHNGKAVGQEARGIQIVPRGNAASKKFTITLVDGQNTFRATGFSRDRTESNPSEVTVFLAAPQKEISLYLFASGINTYKNPALNLNFAEPDARALVGFFKGAGGGLFKHVYVTDYYNDQATKTAITGELTQLESTNPQDVVVLYLAGHGEDADGKWYFIPYELTYPEREEDVKAGGLSSDELAGFIRKIKAQKVLVLIDACKAGAALVAFRGFEDRKALSQLSRSTGVHVVAASTNSQFAAEVKELGHGVFTYTLLQGLSGKAAGAGEAVTVRKLLGYIEEQLPEITKKYKQEAQYPVVDSRGMDFPLVVPK
jgi:hypothetical protein